MNEQGGFEKRIHTDIREFSRIIADFIAKDEQQIEKTSEMIRFVEGIKNESQQG